MQSQTSLEQSEAPGEQLGTLKETGHVPALSNLPAVDADGHEKACSSHVNMSWNSITVALTLSFEANFKYSQSVYDKYRFLVVSLQKWRKFKSKH